MGNVCPCLRVILMSTVMYLAVLQAPFGHCEELTTAEQNKLAPQVAQWLDTRAAQERERFVVTFDETMVLDRLPDFVATEAPDSPVNTLIQMETELAIEEIKASRAPAYERLREELAHDYSAVVLENFWITKAVLLEAPLAEVTELARRPDVSYIEAEDSGTEPPDSIPTNDVEDGRALIGSDPYFSAFGQAGRFALLDTGVAASHVLFSGSPTIVLSQRNCFLCTLDVCRSNGPGSACIVGFYDLCNHGTLTAGILSGNASMGSAYRGITRAQIDSIVVYNVSTCRLSIAAAVRGFEAAIARGAHVIVAEIQDRSVSFGSISTAADNAFNLGKIVIAANGNYGPEPGTVASPANAHKAIGVAAYDVVSLVDWTISARGPAEDGRIKPDLTMPNRTETASNVTPTGLLVFGGTSGATPYAAGMAMLWRNYLLAQTGVSPHPGLVYAHLILSGPLAFPSFDSIRGVGHASMPSPAATFFRGQVSITAGQTLSLPLSMGTGSRTSLQAALWWPEEVGGQVNPYHNKIELRLVDPTGAVKAASTHDLSVFQRASVTGSIAPGTWTLTIKGASVLVGPQTVFWAAYTK